MIASLIPWDCKFAHYLGALNECYKRPFHYPKNEKGNVQILLPRITMFWPSCVPMALKFAKESSNFNVDVIQSEDFSEMAKKYNVGYGPKVVVNGTIALTEGVPEEEFIGRILYTINNTKRPRPGTPYKSLKARVFSF